MLLVFLNSYFKSIVRMPGLISRIYGDLVRDLVFAALDLLAFSGELVPTCFIGVPRFLAGVRFD
jgi:hypothetical protein